MPKVRTSDEIAAELKAWIQKDKDNPFGLSRHTSGNKMFKPRLITADELAEYIKKTAADLKTMGL